MTVKVGFTSFLLRKYSCKDVMTVLIENVLNMFFGSNRSLWFFIIKKIEPGPKAFQSLCKSA
jgi:hypothetical protein